MRTWISLLKSQTGLLWVSSFVGLPELLCITDYLARVSNSFDLKWRIKTLEMKTIKEKNITKKRNGLDCVRLLATHRGSICMHVGCAWTLKSSGTSKPVYAGLHLGQQARLLLNVFLQKADCPSSHISPLFGCFHKLDVKGREKSGCWP